MLGCSPTIFASIQSSSASACLCRCAFNDTPPGAAHERAGGRSVIEEPPHGLPGMLRSHSVALSARCLPQSDCSDPQLATEQRLHHFRLPLRRGPALRCRATRRSSQTSLMQAEHTCCCSVRPHLVQPPLLRHLRARAGASPAHRSLLRAPLTALQGGRSQPRPLEASAAGRGMPRCVHEPRWMVQDWRHSSPGMRPLSCPPPLRRRGARGTPWQARATRSIL